MKSVTAIIDRPLLALKFHIYLAFIPVKASFINFGVITVVSRVRCLIQPHIRITPDVISRILNPDNSCV